MSNGEFVFVYSTFPDKESAEKVGRSLVTARLAACVNIFPPMTSIYEWENRIDSRMCTDVGQPRRWLRQTMTHRLIAAS